MFSFLVLIFVDMAFFRTHFSEPKEEAEDDGQCATFFYFFWEGSFSAQPFHFSRQQDNYCYNYC